MRSHLPRDEDEARPGTSRGIILRVRRPTTVGELWHYSRSIIWLRTTLDDLATLEQALRREMLEEAPYGRNRDKYSADQRVLVEAE